VAGELVDGASEVVAASIAYVEARAAVARAFAGGRLTRRGRRGARLELDTIWEELTALELDLDLVRQAGDVAERSGLRAGDAIHLATALRLDEPDLLIATWDGELRRAALESGIAVAP
jgi:hypothetical protein